MENRKLGRDGPSVFPIGLGCMSIGIGDVYTSSARDDNAGIDLIHRALDLGVTHLDTANSYGTSELQVGKALAGRRAGVDPRHEVRVRDEAGWNRPAHRWNTSERARRVR